LAFEYNEDFLLALSDHLYTGRYGTFLKNNLKERRVDRLHETTVSVWQYFCDSSSGGVSSRYINADYCRYEGTLLPSTASKNVVLWEGRFRRRDYGKVPINVREPHL